MPPFSDKPNVVQFPGNSPEDFVKFDELCKDVLSSEGTKEAKVANITNILLTGGKNVQTIKAYLESKGLYTPRV